MFPNLGARLVAHRARRLGPERLVDASLETSLTRAAAMDPDLRRRMIGLTDEQFEWPEVTTAYADAARSLLAYLVWGMRGDLGRATSARPTLLVFGRDDRLVSLHAARHAAHVYPISLRVLDGVGHAPQLEDPARVVDTVTGWLGERRLDGWDAPAPSAPVP